jgi:hypothetical protein
MFYYEALYGGVTTIPKKQNNNKALAEELRNDW